MLTITAVGRRPDPVMISGAQLCQQCQNELGTVAGVELLGQPVRGGGHPAVLLARWGKNLYYRNQPCSICAGQRRSSDLVTRPAIVQRAATVYEAERAPKVVPVPWS